MKYIDPRTKKDRAVIANEIAMMSISKSDQVIQYEEAFEYREKLWVFMELMDLGCFTGIIKSLK